MASKAAMRPMSSRDSLRSPPRRLLSRRSFRSTMGNGDDAMAQQDELDAEQFMDDEDDISALESNIIRKSKTIDDFTRIIAEWRTEKDKTGEGSTTASILRNKTSAANLSAANLLAVDRASSSQPRSSGHADADAASSYSYDPSSVGDLDEDTPVPLSSSQNTAAGPSNDMPLLGRARCTCCCGKGPRKCRRARRAAREWADIENDLQLAAQIGQALLRRTDALQAELTSKDDEGSSRLDSVMKRLTASIKEISQLEKRLEQSDLNVEAADASNRALVRELDETRKELQKSSVAYMRATASEARIQSSEQELQDLRQELALERKRVEQTSAQLKRVEQAFSEAKGELKLAQARSGPGAMTEEDRAKRREELHQIVEEKMAKRHDAGGAAADGGSSVDSTWIKTLVSENEAMSADVSDMRRLLQERDEELSTLREELEHRSVVIGEPADVSLTTTVSEASALAAASKSATPSLDLHHELEGSRGTLRQHETDKTSTTTSESVGKPSTSAGLAVNTDASSAAESTKATTASTHPPASVKRESRTSQLNVLIDYVQRIFARLASADVDTLARRLQRQKLTGDVGHLARTTVTGIVRDADGLREHFTRAMNNETKGRDIDGSSLSSSRNGNTESDSLVSRKEFYALIKMFKELIYELARLRGAINEISLQPQLASKILQEQLGIHANEEKSVGAWIGRLFSAPTAPGSSSTLPASSAATQALGRVASSGPGLAPIDRRASSQLAGPSRATASATSSAVAVEVVRGRNATDTGSNLDSESNGHSPRVGSIDSGSAAPSPHLGTAALKGSPGPRTQSMLRKPSRNLSGLFVGAGGTSEGGDARTPSLQRVLSNNHYHHRLSRVVDDDEISIHQGTAPRIRTLRPRNLSDSSMHTTYLNDADEGEGSDARKPASGQARRPLGTQTASGSGAPMSRIITPNSLSLQTNTREPSSSGYGVPNLLSGGVAKAFGFLSSAGSPTAADAPSSAVSALSEGKTSTAPSAMSTLDIPHAPRLRSKSSKAELSRAAASMDRAERIFSTSSSQR